ncbi:MAG: nodulation protein NfeD [Myxococcota bacterium]|nr:nodulation protein NfeD [Myxococcota bacterium]
MKRVLGLGVAVALLFGMSLVTAPTGHATTVHVVGLEGTSINPASADYLLRAIERAEAEDAGALLIELDTPGGLVSSMMDIVGAMLNSKVPIIVHVTPRGAMAGSAGVFITMAGHVAAMAPGTTIGAAHPINPAGANPKPPTPVSDDESEEDAAAPGPDDYALEKAENLLAKYVETIAKQRGRNTEWAEDAVRNSVVIDSDEAAELGVIDFVVSSREDLFEKLEGLEVELDGEKTTLALADSNFVPIEMTFGQRFFSFLSDPNIAAILLMAGLLGLYVEVNNPGMILPGVAGAVCFVLTAIAMQILPFSWVGLLLILAGVGLLVAEIFVTSFGTLFTAGILCLLFGGTMLFDLPESSNLSVSFWSVLVPAVSAVAVFGGIMVFALSRSMFADQTAGIDELIGLVGKTTSAVAVEGKVFVRGEYWNACSDELIEEGESVEIVAVDGLILEVKRAQA